MPSNIFGIGGQFIVRPCPQRSSPDRFCTGRVVYV